MTQAPSAETPEIICKKCKQPIADGETGLRHYGWYTAHSEVRCIELLETRLRATEKDLRQALDDANQDAKRLVDDKMKLWERTIELERELAALQQASEGRERELTELRAMLGGFAVDAMQQDFCEIQNWASTAKIEWPNGAPVLAALSIAAPAEEGKRA